MVKDIFEIFTWVVFGLLIVLVIILISAFFHNNEMLNLGTIRNGREIEVAPHEKYVCKPTKKTLKYIKLKQQIKVIETKKKK